MRSSSRVLALLLLSYASVATAVRPGFVPKRLYMDWVALNSKSTARHIMRSRTPEGRTELLQIKTEILAGQSGGTFVVDAFSEAARQHSTDEESRASGGLLGRRLRQGVCREPALDRACFCSPLGRVTGPLETSEGWHLVLVEERIGLEMHDQGMSRVVPEVREDGVGVRSVLRPPDPAEASELFEPGVLLNVAGFVVVTSVGGQLLSSWASSIDLQQLAERLDV